MRINRLIELAWNIGKGYEIIQKLKIFKKDWRRTEQRFVKYIRKKEKTKKSINQDN